MTAVEGSRARQEDNGGRKRVGMGGLGCTELAWLDFIQVESKMIRRW